MDMETLWFVLWGLLWAIYFILDGFDLGLGILRPFIARSEEDLHVIHHATGPFWDGNEVWLITAGGVTFAAFPKVYAVMFSALYAPLLLLLFALIFRAVSMEFRDKVDSPCWRKVWDIGLFAGSFVPALLLGVAFANLFIGIPIDNNGVYHGNLLKLLNPYGLAGGIVFVVLFMQHGALWLAIRADGELRERAVSAASSLWMLSLAGLLVFLWLTSLYTSLYDNYMTHPQLLIFPILAVTALLIQRPLLASGVYAGSWACSALLIFCVTFFGLAGMYPGMLISSLNPAWTITAFNGASSPLTLSIMLGVALCALPFVFIYQIWVYKTFADTPPHDGGAGY